MENAAGAIRSLAVNANNQATLMQLGAGPKLLKLLDDGTSVAMENAAEAIENLAFKDDNQLTLMQLGAGPKLLTLLDDGTSVAKEKAAVAIRSLAANDDNKVTLMQLGAGPKLLKSLNDVTPAFQRNVAGALRTLPDRAVRYKLHFQDDGEWTAYAKASTWPQWLPHTWEMGRHPAYDNRCGNPLPGYRHPVTHQVFANQSQVMKAVAASVRP